MANLTEDGSTSWYEIAPGKSAICECSGDFGSGTATIEMRSIVDTTTAITCVYPSTIDGTSEFAAIIENASGQTRYYRVTLASSTSPDLDVTIE